MLGIQLQQVDDRRVVLFLQGCIVAASVDLLERECLALDRSGFRVVLDLESVVFIDRSGLKRLGRMGHAGVRIVGCAPLLAAMLADEGIAVNRTMR